MLLTIPGLLDQVQLENIHQVLADVPFVDGRFTAGFAAARIKDNLELRADPTRMKLLIRILMASLGHHHTFRFGALPTSGSRPHLCPLPSQYGLRRPGGRSHRGQY